MKSITARTNNYKPTRPEDFIEYKGQLNSHNKPHGKGKMTWTLNGDIYIGEFASGLPDGFGEMFYATLQNRYVGSFSKGQRHGIGTMLLSSGDELSGEFNQDALEGFAVIFYSSGAFYEGEISNSERNGEGILRYPDGSVYYGHFYNNVRYGVGRYVLPDGVQNFYGNWSNDKFTGRGRATKYIDNSGILAVFEGQFIDGKLHGEGVTTDSLGTCYKGEFQNGLMHGNGELLMPSGGKYVGEFFYNDFRKGKAERSDRSVAYGSFYNFAPEGVKIRMMYSNGEEYEGSMIGGKRSGLGVYTSAEGISTLAKFEDNQVHGDARISLPDGGEYYATFNRGIEIETRKEKSPPQKNKKYSQFDT